MTLVTCPAGPLGLFGTRYLARKAALRHWRGPLGNYLSLDHYRDGAGRPLFPRIY